MIKNYLLFFFVIAISLNGLSQNNTFENGRCIYGDCKNGLSTFKYDSGDSYEGNYFNGKRNGGGKYTYKDGSYYNGYWSEGKKEGKGIYVCKGFTYSGIFSNDNFKDNKAKIIFNNDTERRRESYEGAVDGTINGNGKLTYIGDSVYTGSFKNSLRHGFGLLKNKNGERIKSGSWENDKLVTMDIKSRADIEKITDPELKAQMYRDLQYQAEYKNQLDYKEGESICNVSSLSIALSLFDKNKSPEELNNEIANTGKLLNEYKKATTPEQKNEILKKISKYNICNENNIEDCIKEQNFGRGRPETRGLVARQNGVEQKNYKDANGKETPYNWVYETSPSKIATNMEKELNEGNAVVMSVGIEKGVGHVVRVVNINYKDGKPYSIIVDDPYGKDLDFAKREYYEKNKSKIKAERTSLQNEIGSLDKKIKTEKDAEKKKQLIKEKTAKENRRKEISNNGYGCFAHETCDNKNDKNNPQKGKQDEWLISDLEKSKSGIRIKMYETYYQK